MGGRGRALGMGGRKGEGGGAREEEEWDHQWVLRSHQNSHWITSIHFT